MSQVSLKNVTKIYGEDVEAVRKISLGVESKEFLVLVGPSGCGKSTVLRMIAGLEDVTKGDIYIGDKLVNDVPAKDRDIAMVFQNYALYPHMNVYNNMAFGLKLRKIPVSEIDNRVKEAAAILGIDNLLKRKPKELSGGQKQRVAVGRAIVRKPLVFLFDEPLSNLDAKFRVQMRTEIHKLHNRLKTTMIYVTHDQVEAMTLGDRVAVMRDGIIHQCDKPMSIYDTPVDKFVAGFIGSPPMNFVNGTINKKNGRLFFDEGNFQVGIVDQMRDVLSPYAGKDIIFGIRPEDIYDKLFVTKAQPEDTVSVVVDVVETMGSEVYLYINTQKHSFIARVGSRSTPEMGKKLDVVFDMTKVHFFDKDTEKTIV
ncbi:MAG: sn-glycerol-3-phosphate ABC transporter ATP-binding protein UgpC [Candidatus Omnitrophica bacterium]|nr:sn-glycerol-3-phosphate ABC transporter ATP-binding protein UgpC [Candidatus Omnitrophota bacterium]MBU4487460.1 sn-glycerol-3-phosphate ABC transporter ATP-binding protein UgpC [Candidatus Omnitrophota bacterium]MCG2705106.1 sn-glycerol-3-phosphate ABC transporter ATP-binding protein UgpC [Candidatus Omnitrophota bacterium]